MAVKLILAPDVLDDLENIHRYIARASPRAAPMVVTRILESATNAAEMPMASAMVPEYEIPSLRQVRAFDYRIIFRVLPDAIRVLIVVHGAQELKPILDARL